MVNENHFYINSNIVKNTRRDFLTKRAHGATIFAVGLNSSKAETQTVNNDLREKYQKLDEVAAQPILKAGLFPDPLIIESLDLLRYKNNFICRIQWPRR